MVEQDSLKWHRVLSDYFGLALSDQTAIRWWRELTEGPAAIQTDNDELVSAIRFHAADPHSKDFGKPDLGSLRIWVFVYRKSRSERRIQQMLDGGDHSFLNHVKANMRAAIEEFDDMGAAWDIMCAPDRYAGADRETTVEECMILERWAEETWPTWKRPDFASRDPSKSPRLKCRQPPNQRQSNRNKPSSQYEK